LELQLNEETIMKRTILLLLSILIALIINAQVSKTVTIVAGGLSSALTSTEKTTVTNLTITGTVDARDFKTMRDDVSSLAVLNLSGATIVTYTGPDGTYGSDIYYAGNTVPMEGLSNALTLLTVTLPSTIVCIESNAFSNCMHLNSINIPNGTTTIKFGAFQFCTRLPTLTIPASVTSIEDYVFHDCSAYFTVDGGNLNYSSDEGILYNKGKTELLKYPISKDANYLFPATVTTIGNEAFAYCEGFTSLVIPLSVTTIKNKAFWDCESLIDLSLPKFLTTIESTAFGACLNLASLTINKNVPPDLSSVINVFEDVNQTTCTLWVPTGSKAAYEIADQWMDFTHIIEMPGIHVSKSNVSFNLDAGSQNIIVTSSATWNAVSNKSWLTVSPSSGAIGSTLVTVSAAENSGDTRTGSITFSASGSGDQIITATQAGAITTFPWNEGFENGGVIPAYWTMEQENGSGINWIFISGDGIGHPPTAHGGTYNACLIDESTSDNKTRLISPTINLNKIGTPTLTFWHTQPLYSPDQDKLTVFYKTSTGGTWTQLAAYTTNIAAWRQETISLPNSSSKYYICFEGNAKYGYGICVDDISVTGVPIIVPPNYELSDETLGTGEVTCYNATDTIFVAGDGTTVSFESGSSATLIAGKSIQLLPGFHASEGCFMNAKITIDASFCSESGFILPPDTTVEKSVEVPGKSSAITDYIKYKTVKVVPNPNNGRFAVQLTNFDNMVEISLYNVLGKKVFHSATNLPVYDIDLPEIGKGIYFIKARSGNEQVTKKMVVN
jgi:hypothetical protein